MKQRPNTPIGALVLGLALLVPVRAATQSVPPPPGSGDQTRAHIEELKQQLRTVLQARLAAFDVALQDGANAEMRERWEATTKQIDRLLVQLAASEKELSAPARQVSAERKSIRSIKWFAFFRRKRPAPGAQHKTAAVAPIHDAATRADIQAEREFHRLLRTLARRIEGDRRDLERAQSKNDRLQAKTEALAQAVQQLEARVRELEGQTPVLQEEEVAHARHAGLAFSGEERTQAIDAMLRTRKQLRVHEDEIGKQRKERSKALHKSLRMREKAARKQRTVNAIEEKVASSFHELEAAIQAHPRIVVPEYVQRLLESRQGRLLADVDSP